MRKLIFVTIVLFWSSSCSTLKEWMGFGDDSDQRDPPQAEGVVPAIEEEDHDYDNVREASNEELELKIAKLWSRVQELEEKVRYQKQRQKILEKGLMLGIIPEELMHEADGTIKRDGKRAPDDLSISKKLPKKTKIQKRKMNPKVDPMGFEQHLTAAQQFFEAAQYGRAIAAYGKLQNNYPDKTSDGSAKYWIALSWLKLREYDSANQGFTAFISKHPDSAWLPRAHYHLAQTESQLGYREKALKRMRELIKKFPKEDAAQMAKSEIARLEL